MTTYVYMILNTINGKMYIGQSCSKYRWQEHIYTSENPEYDKHRLIHRAMSKHGVSNFEFRVIQSFNKTEDALEAEKYWIAFYKTNICRYRDGLGYNLTDGGESTKGLKWRESSKKKFGEQVRGENNNAAKLTTEDVVKIKHMILAGVPLKEIAPQFNVSKENISDIKLGRRWSHVVITNNQDDIEKMLRNGNTGKKASIETRQKMSKSKRRESLSDETRKKMSVSHQGEKHCNALITSEQAKEIKKLLASGMKPIEVSRKLEISKNIVYSISSGQSWTHI